MAETERTFAELQALLATNGAEDISAQDLRDLMVTALGGYAMLGVVGNATPQALTAVPAKVVAFDTAGPERGCASSVPNSQITVGAAGDYNVTWHTSALTSVAGASIVEVVLYADAVAVVLLHSHRDFSPNSPGSFSFAGIATLAAGAVLEVRATATPDKSTTFEDAQLTVKRVG